MTSGVSQLKAQYPRLAIWNQVELNHVLSNICRSDLYERYYHLYAALGSLLLTAGAYGGNFSFKPSRLNVKMGYGLARSGLAVTEIPLVIDTVAILCFCYSSEPYRS